MFCIESDVNWKPSIAALLSVGLLTACTQETPDRGGGQREARALPVQAVEVHPRDLSRVVTISNSVEPLRTIRLAARTEGVLTEVLVEEGDTVAEDQILARIDVREQQAELARARARLHERQATFDRFEQLRERNYVDLASYESARAELEVAATEVELWETRVEFGTVTSSIDGTVVSRYIEPGEAISRHAALFSIADLSSLVVRLGVSELDVGNLRVGDAVVVNVDAVGDRNPLSGVIRRIFPAAEIESRLITVEVGLPEALGAGVRPGFLARARLLVEQRANVLAVPAGSVAESDGEFFVMVVNGDDRLERRVIEPGVIRGAWREILSGLGEGDRVVSANPLEMTAGERVRVVDLMS
ncbi:MAG: efflux RND transporter periplasmic adaptor subunit [Wenzhouxiangella sp.]|nr:MAG: efflux RND transporter periplasmic adaptor subunit [Wenzhouxiangella sp.]